jgi:Holliday junction resolvase RusA-like endonuclease
MIVIISDKLPPTLNDQISDARSGLYVSAKVKKAWTKRIRVAAKDLEKFSPTDKVWCEFSWYLKNFGRDADNVAAAAKYIFDGLVDAEVISNDNLIVIQSPVVHYYHRGKADWFELTMSNSPEFLWKSWEAKVRI